jgi:plasmid stability protein
MRNITISVPEELAHWLRVWAAKQDTSVSAAVSALLQEQMRLDTSYQAAYEHVRSLEPSVLKESGGYPSRDEIHER